MLVFGFVLLGAGLGGVISYCYFVPKIHTLAREAENQLKKVQENNLKSK